MNQSLNFSEIESSLFNEHNKIRTNPKSYIPILRNVTQYYRKLNILHFIGETPFKTHEGKNLVESTIKILETQQPLQELVYSHELAQASKMHVKDIGKKGIFSHEGSDGSTVSDRVEKFCQWDLSLVENLDVGTQKPENIMVKLIMCDGDKTRFQRKNIFNENMKYIGIGVGEHAIYGFCCVIVMAERIRNLLDEVNEHSFYLDYLKGIRLKTQKKKHIKDQKVFRKCDNVLTEVTKQVYKLDDGTLYVEEVNLSEK